LNGRDFLLDRHAAIWWMEAQRQATGALLSCSAKAGIRLRQPCERLGGRDQNLVRQASTGGAFGARVEASRFAFLPLTLEHVEEVGALPLHHRDPFDRMLVAQARVERLTLVTGDRKLAAYAVHRFWT
jgi:PIN domain nuclease of toxin-antitoxin system